MSAASRGIFTPECTPAIGQMARAALGVPIGPWRLQQTGSTPPTGIHRLQGRLDPQALWDHVRGVVASAAPPGGDEQSSTRRHDPRRRTRPLDAEHG
jgi:hypothetical protein